MSYVALCLFMLRGPVSPSVPSEKIPAERLFALVEDLAGVPVRRDDPALDLVAIPFTADDPGLKPKAIALVLRLNGIYLHRVASSEGDIELVASRDPKPPPRTPPRLVVRVYAPQFAQPEDIVAGLGKAIEGKPVEVVIEPRTGKIVVRAPDAQLAESVVAAAAARDRRDTRERTFHLYRFKGMFVADGHAELLRRLPQGIRARVALVPTTQANTLLVGCGSADWEDVLALLRKINPGGEVVEDAPAEEARP